MASILKTAGKRNMRGSDWPVCLNRGKAFSLGSDQHWPLGEEDSSYARIGSKAWMAFYQTALLLNLDQIQIEDIFCNNAVALFGN